MPGPQPVSNEDSHPNNIFCGYLNLLNSKITIQARCGVKYLKMTHVLHVISKPKKKWSLKY